MSQNNRSRNAQPPDESHLYILTERDLEVIDGLISMLNLAITEVLVSKAAKIRPLKNCPIQETFNKQCYDIIESDIPAGDCESSPD